jgi:type IV secretion system protein VirB6
MSAITMTGMVSGVDGVAQSFLTEVYPALASAVATPVYLAAVLYWALFGYRIYAGHAPLQWKDLLAKAVMTAGVFGALSWGELAAQIYNVFLSFMEGAATTVMAGQSTPDLLDTLFQSVSAVADALQRSSFYQLGMVLAGLALFVLNCALFVVALCYMTIAKIGLAITMVLLPLFAGFFLFEQTRHWGMNWVNKMLTFSLMYVLVVAIVKFGFQAFHDSFEAVGAFANDTSTLQKATDISLVSGQIYQLAIAEGVLILFMLSVRSWAAALASGASSSTGILMMLFRSAVAKGVGK